MTRRFLNELYLPKPCRSNSDLNSGYNTDEILPGCDDFANFNRSSS